MMAAGSFGSTSLFPGNESKIAYGGADLDILLGVNTWQHVWLMDWGVGGKKEFLEGWWNAVDWDVVEFNMQSNTTSKEGSAGSRKSNPLSRVGYVGRKSPGPDENVY